MPEYREEPDGSVRKQCCRCKEWRRPEGFPLLARSTDGLMSYCRRCEAANLTHLTAEHKKRAAENDVKRNYRNGSSAKYFRKLAGED